MNQDFLARLVELFQFGSLAAFGGMVKFLREHQGGTATFSIFRFFIQLAVAFFVGCFLGDILKGSDQFKDGYLMAAGYCANEVLTQLELFVKNKASHFNKGGKE